MRKNFSKAAVIFGLVFALVLTGGVVASALVSDTNVCSNLWDDEFEEL